MTRTAALDYIKDGIHMNSVDTGWITDEDPAHITAAKREEHGFHPPLDHVDAAGDANQHLGGEASSSASQHGARGLKRRCALAVQHPCSPAHPLN